MGSWNYGNAIAEGVPLQSVQFRPTIVDVELDLKFFEACYKLTVLAASAVGVIMITVART